MELIGHVTSSYASSVLGYPIALALVAGAAPAWGQTLYVPMPGGDLPVESDLAGLLRSDRSANQWLNRRSVACPLCLSSNGSQACRRPRDSHSMAARTARAALHPVWGVAFSEEACRANTGTTRATLWMGPDEYLLLDFAAGASASTLIDALESAVADVPHALVDISHRQFAFEVSGPHAATILSGACPLDLDLAEFPLGMCTRTVLAKADVVACGAASGCLSPRGLALVSRAMSRAF